MTEADDLQSIEKLGQVRDAIVNELRKAIVGMDDVIDEMMIAIFARGHCLLVGVPGLAKTLLVSSLDKSIDRRSDNRGVGRYDFAQFTWPEKTAA